MDRTCIIGLDQSTQGTKAILMDADGGIVGKTFMPHRQIISPEGWVSHDGEEIYRNSVAVCRRLLEEAADSRIKIAGIGISNQRETTVCWDRESGEPVEHAIVWQCARGGEITSTLTDGAFRDYVRERTGIPLSPYFPGAKAAWMLKHNARARELARQGSLCIGTIDSWLVYKMTGKQVFHTDYSNASRTQLMDLHRLCWDENICAAFGIPKDALPTVTDSDGFYGTTTFEGLLKEPVPILAVMGDSHAALYGQGCTHPGMAKATYGTGSSIMMNIGQSFCGSKSGLVTSLAWSRGGKVDYVLEGNINYAGAVITWLQDELGLIERVEDTERMAFEANGEDSTYLVPAFSGLGAPHWNDEARAVFCGMSRTTGKKELVKAGLESIAYQVADVVEAMSQDAGVAMTELRVDGGPTGNAYLMQFQSDMTGAVIRVPETQELSAMGAAFMAGIKAGLYSEEEVLNADRLKARYFPKMDRETRRKKYDGWKKAVAKT